ncbi:MAG: hypothetical protein JAY99_16655 [Candidatus Thiodiazotropha lotti]|uniref:Thyroglobulin type-1 domain-containing protein n=1 Tax=Candidatus Thiodiazotropha endoloripes TaxID=1818881 RepID=A0A1E2UTL2_9GAMM|nr:hypothetical protein [Candidatus Thiodiazotropha endoloripes]MCG7897314.1 hypothetical protein [Candidatus Thiodiazotropha weberae]MCG7990927.1 hypothetical protein [Candidatus Thiodiazotropha lotti]MCG7903083.1 hypothetical protein [Candidatus Thiodiazotropha weberae]MCG7914627.1 hypothetical protein [Candidatus Thiodiazotropha weberae]MCG8001151.1 hypothetical protein [Candidatus Thiodiazotropha lotti]
MSAKRIALIYTLLVGSVLLATTLQADEIATEQKPTGQNKTYTAGSDNKPKLSRKCAIYSGICPMNKRSEVGAYCICNTPSGPIHGVVIP